MGLIIRFILGVFGAIFSWITLAMFFAALTIGGILWMYARDLPCDTSACQPSTASQETCTV